MQAIKTHLQAIKEDTLNTETLTNLIMARQNKTVINGIEIILPIQGNKMTFKERLRDAKKQAETIVKLLN
ncbi:hypothetical protein Phi4:1_gp123 [Cellulophaga phage phi4:1]|jgi:hypothetical protein|uniref:Uncharacterized protein n=5 Tax=Lightbulbvirus TaxID=1918522 RepID=A0A0S2MWR6_9CAUD|nr:hypothetical protein Phi4:1_gp123 [Cellulophaga phage phi4:1]YP_008241622.1 hypothetical protein Phi17:2_gp127 [Cellulophaga phage phi17:2]ALO80132.1 hypothetical protein Phi4113_123 [Cellulophaga phage phi4:1_13]ALO80329.1 hypothetical protein Phi4118_123 [Cellulophaga phage phi4:1_18]ALO80530.1 hypothetical protein Phi17218_127 [Cellulophaga phage phi17:2_18]AGO47660.1 hypothetical protein Phi17:2_gp127 [Cellulophaga phage phi17:2]AGO49536.1 hypothetical protein Phi4:1_gp123 [Cellulophag|tara:strand:- start:270 stop:479 length:210 start_codon:yes stop_codon:yes gene_type:complete